MELEEALKLIKTQEAAIAKNDSDLAAIKVKNEELYSETKKAKAKAKEEADTTAKAIADQAAKDGDHEQLLEISKAELKKEIDARKASDDELAGLKSEIASSNHAKHINDFSMTLEPLSSHVMGDLSHRLKSRTQVVDGKLRVLDKDGNLTASSLDDLKGELVASGEISHLIKGNQSSGGDSSGGSQTPNEQNLTSVQKIAAGLEKRQ